MVAWLVLAVLGGSPDVGWKLAVDGDVKIFTRPKEGARVFETKAEAVLEASPAEVRAVLLDEDYSHRTPYIADNRIVERPSATLKVRYTRLAFPIIDDRDYFIAISLDQDLGADGSGSYHASWKPWGLDRPAMRGVVRVTTNEGYWDVQPLEGGKKSAVVYYLLSDPGGYIPGWVGNLGNKRVLPDIIHSMYKEILRTRAAGRDPLSIKW